MKKRVFIIHGWDGSPYGCWLPWLGIELENRGFKVEIPAMPNSERPEMDIWVSYLASLVGVSDENTYFVGHSIGCQTILRYIETLGPGEKIGGAVFAAGFFHLKDLANDEERSIAAPWLETPIDERSVQSHGGKFVAIFSDNDPVVPLSDKEIFKEKFGAEVIVEHKKGHLSEDAGVKELPSAFGAILEISGEE